MYQITDRACQLTRGMEEHPVMASFKERCADVVVIQMKGVVMEGRVMKGVVMEGRVMKGVVMEARVMKGVVMEGG